MITDNPGKLKGKTVAILVANGFEQIELTEPRRALEAVGVKTVIVSPSAGKVQGMDHDEKGEAVTVDVALKDAKAADYDGLVLPGGVANPDKLRVDKDALAFIKAIADAGKPIAAICHGSWPLIEVGLAKGRKMTSYPSLKTDLVNAGAQWVDQEVVTDRGLTTSRTPRDLPAFNRKMIEELSEGRHGAHLEAGAKGVTKAAKSSPPGSRADTADKAQEAEESGFPMGVKNQF